MQTVTRFEPRTPHQPEKLKKLSKNEFVCTDFRNSSQSKITRRNCMCFQSSAARPQTPDRIWCRPAKILCAEGVQDAGSAHSSRSPRSLNPVRAASCLVKIKQKCCGTRGLSPMQPHHSSLAEIRNQAQQEIRIRARPCSRAASSGTNRAAFRRCCGDSVLANADRIEHEQRLKPSALLPPFAARL